MSDFDPYYKWLSIPPEEQPPTHYRLLGVQMLEQNAEVIEAAANRQMAYLQELSSGNDHIDEAQGLLGEVARARVCLLTAESKARYDAELVSTLDSLPEAEEEASAPQAEPIVNASRTPKPSSARRSSSTARRKTTSGSRGHSSGSKKSISRKKINTGDSTKESSSLAIKIVAAVVPAVLVLIIGVILMSGGSGGKNKANNISNPETAGRSSQSDAGKGVEKDSLAAATTKFSNKAEQTASNRPPTPVVKPPKADSQPENSKLDKPSQPPAAAEPTIQPDSKVPQNEKSTDESEAGELLANENLEPVGLNKWRDKTLHREIENLVELLEQPAESYNPTEQEIDKKIQDKKRTIGSQNKKLWHDYKHETPEFNRNSALLASVGKFEIQDHVTLYFPEAPNQPFHYPANKVAPISLRDEAIKELQNEAGEILSTQARKDLQKNLREIHNKLTKRYVELKAREEIKDALDKVAGEFSKPPALPEATNPESTQFTSAGSPADDPSNNNSEQDDPSTGSGDKGEQKKPTKPEPTLSYAELKEKLTELEKNTRSSLSAFNTGAKEYIQQKENLGKRIEKGEKVLAQQTNLLIRMPENTEAQRIKKQETGKKIEEKITGPLDGLKSQRDKIPKPDTAQIEGNLSQAKKMLEQIQGLPEYAANPKSIDSLAEKIAKYRRGFEGQQTKMAK